MSTWATRVVVWGGLLALAPAACAKSRSAGGTGSEVSTVVPLPMHEVHKAVQVGDDLGPAAFLPRDSAGVIGFSLKKFTVSTPYHELKDLFEAGLAQAGGIKEKCGIDLTTDVHGIVFAIAGDKGPSHLVAVVSTPLGEAKVSDCVLALANSSTRTLEVKRSGHVVSFVSVDAPDKTLHAAWQPGGQVVVTDDSAEALEALIAGRGVLGENRVLASLIKHTDTAATVWVALNIDSARGWNNVGFETPPKALYGALDIGAGLDGQIKVRFPDEIGAQQASDLLTRELQQSASNPMVGNYLSGVNVVADQSEAVIHVKMSEDNLRSLSGMIASMLPMLMGH